MSRRQPSFPTEIRTHKMSVKPYTLSLGHFGTRDLPQEPEGEMLFVWEEMLRKLAADFTWEGEIRPPKEVNVEICPGSDVACANGFAGKTVCIGQDLVPQLFSRTDDVDILVSAAAMITRISSVLRLVRAQWKHRPDDDPEVVRKVFRDLGLP